MPSVVADDEAGVVEMLSCACTDLVLILIMQNRQKVMVMVVLLFSLIFAAIVWLNKFRTMQHVKLLMIYN